MNFDIVGLPLSAAITGSIVALTCAALVARAVVGRPDWPLLMLTSVATVVIGAVIISPSVWTPEMYVGLEAFAALCAVSLALSVRRLGLVSLAGVVTIGVVGGLVCYLVPTGMRWGYRGLAVVDVAAAWLLLSSFALANGGLSRLRSLAVPRLGLYLALQAIYAASWEYSYHLAFFFGWLSAAAWCWLCFGLAVEAFRREDVTHVR
jgi:hypothetical protein